MLTSRHVRALVDDLAARRRVEPGDHVEQGGLAASARADHGDDLVPLDGQIDVAHRIDRGVALVEALRDVLQIDHVGPSRRSNAGGRHRRRCWRRR